MTKIQRGKPACNSNLNIFHFASFHSLSCGCKRVLAHIRYSDSDSDQNTRQAIIFDRHIFVLFTFINKTSH